MRRRPLDIALIYQDSRTTCCVPRIDISPAIPDHEARIEIKSIPDASREQQSRFWLSAQARISIVVKAGKDVIDRQSANLKRIVDDLLDVGRAISGKMALDPRPLDLRSTVDSADRRPERSTPASFGLENSVSSAWRWLSRSTPVLAAMWASSRSCTSISTIYSRTASSVRCLEEENDESFHFSGVMANLRSERRGACTRIH